MPRLSIRVVSFLALAAWPAFGPRADASPNRVPQDRVLLPGNIPPRVFASFDLGRVAPEHPMNRMILVLSRRPGAAAALETLSRQQHDPASPLFHRWLTPEEVGGRFGLTDADLARVTQWLSAEGFTIDEISPSRGSIIFSGDAGHVEGAFRTELHEYGFGGEIHHANSVDPSIPRSLSGLVEGIVSLHDFRKAAMHTRPRPAARPQFTGSDGSHALAPADFATIYNVGPLYGAGTDGTGQSIAIVGRSEINLDDVRYFRSFFGLPANDPVFIHNGPAPGFVIDDETEADLDVEWSGAVAPGATVNFVISASTDSTDGVDLSAQYIVEHNLSPVMSTSFGLCEIELGAAAIRFYTNLWAQADVQGITSLVSSGDSGAAGCNEPFDPVGSGLAVSGLSTTTHNVCVGGTEFDEGGNDSEFWNATNDAITQGSAISYIPETAWNESGLTADGFGVVATGGGASSVIPKPWWQSGPGVPSDAARDVPDVSLSAAEHDGYLVVQDHDADNSGLIVISGTSASSPSMAGILALVNQSSGGRLGNANPVFYGLAALQASGGAPAIFHDIVDGSNGVPGLTGFACGPGYDQATGLGSVDAAALAANWGLALASPDFSLQVAPATRTVSLGMAAVAEITDLPVQGFDSSVDLSVSGQPDGVDVRLTPASIVRPGYGSALVTFVVALDTTPGSYPITITGDGAGLEHTATFTLVISQP